MNFNTNHISRDQTLIAALGKVCGDREKDYGDPVVSHEKIAVIWSALLGVSIRADQVASLMAALKLVRLSHQPDHTDSWEDLCGYGALGSEIAAMTLPTHGGHDGVGEPIISDEPPVSDVPPVPIPASEADDGAQAAGEQHDETEQGEGIAQGATFVDQAAMLVEERANDLYRSFMLSMDGHLDGHVREGDDVIEQKLSRADALAAIMALTAVVREVGSVVNSRDDVNREAIWDDFLEFNAEVLNGRVDFLQ